MISATHTKFVCVENLKLFLNPLFWNSDKTFLPLIPGSFLNCDKAFFVSTRVDKVSRSEIKHFVKELSGLFKN